MRRATDAGLIVGFLVVDFLFFHDILKTGEVTTLPQYMTGFLSILVFAVCSKSLLSPGPLALLIGQPRPWPMSWVRAS